MSMWSIFQRKFMCPDRTHGYLYALNRVKHKYSKCSIETVHVENVLKGRSVLKSMRCVVSFEWQPVSAKSVVVYVSKARLGNHWICNAHASRSQKFDLFRNCRCWFDKWLLGHHDAPIPRALVIGLIRT